MQCIESPTLEFQFKQCGYALYVINLNGEYLMNNKISLVISFFLVMLFSHQASAAPVTIQFEGSAPAGGQIANLSVYTESGFNFNQLDGALALDNNFRVLSSTFGGLGLVGTDIGYVQGLPNFRMTESTGAPFCATSLELGGAFGSSGSVTLTGTLNGGGTVVENVVIAANTYTNVVLPATWINLTQIDAVYSSDFLAVDNVVLDGDISSCAPAPAAVPTMSFWSLALLTTMLGLFGFSRRRVK